MKTAREVLLERHRAAEPRLDRARERAVAGARRAAAGPRWIVTWLGALRMPRVAWGGVAAVWLVILGLNFAARETTPSLPAGPVTEAARSPEHLQALREQKRLFTELVGTLKEMEAEAPRFVPRPRSERTPEIGVA